MRLTRPEKAHRLQSVGVPDSDVRRYNQTALETESMTETNCNHQTHTVAIFGANIVAEDAMLDALYFGHDSMQPIIEMQEKLREAIGVPKREVPAVEDGLERDGDHRQR